MQNTAAQIFGLSNCRRAYQLRDFFQRSGISFRWYPSQSEHEICRLAGVEHVVGLALPLLRLNGLLLSAPAPERVAEALGWRRPAEAALYDLIVVGGGPAGLSAAVSAASEGLRTIVIEKSAVGGQAGSSSRIENYVGFPEGICGWDLALRMRSQAERFGASFYISDAVVGDVQPGSLELASGGGIQGRSVLLATGVEYARLDIDREDHFLDRGVFYGAGASEASHCSGEVVVIGGGNSAAQAALNLASYAHRVFLVVRGDSLQATLSQYLIDLLVSTPNIEIHLTSDVIGFLGGETLTGVRVRNTMTQRERIVQTHHVFVCIGGRPRNPWCKGTKIATDDSGYIHTGRDIPLAALTSYTDRLPLDLETSVPGVFAVGDVRHGSVKRCATAIGEGAAAVSMIHRYLDQLSRTGSPHQDIAPWIEGDDGALRASG